MFQLVTENFKDRGTQKIGNPFRTIHLTENQRWTSRKTGGKTQLKVIVDDEEFSISMDKGTLSALRPF